VTASKNVRKRRKAPGRPFKPGHPGGPGRPAGSRNAATLMLDALADESAREILEKMVEGAKAGDMRAADLILSRAWPVRKGRPVALSIPPIVNAGDIVTALGSVANAMAAGEVTPDEAAAVAGVLELKRRAIETTALEVRVAALEKERADAKH